MTEESIWKFMDDSDLSGYTFIIPSVAVGNVGQLTCDLLISSLDTKKIASVYSPALVPVLGYDPYDLYSETLSSSCEVYKCKSRNIVILQLRAPIVHKYARSFLKDLIKTFKEKHVKDIIILTSSFAYEMKHISTSPFRHLVNELCPYTNKIKTLNWNEHEAKDSNLRIYGGGFASLLFEIINDFAVPCLVLYKYCSEGDNIPDAYEMIKYLTSVIHLFSEKLDIKDQLVQPVSWKLLFGKPPPNDIY